MAAEIVAKKRAEPVWYSALVLVAMAVGGVFAIYFRSWLLFGIAACICFVVLCGFYAMAAWMLGWPKLRLRESIGEVINFLSWS
jgi:hypothetical protein